MSKWSMTVVSLQFVTSSNSRRQLTSSLKGRPWVISKVKSQQQLWESLTFRLEQAVFSHGSLCTPCEQSRAVYDIQGNWQVAFVAIKSMWDLYGHSALNRCNKLLEPAWGWRLLHNNYIYILDLHNVHVNLLNGHVKIHNHHVDFAEWSCK